MKKIFMIFAILLMITAVGCTQEETTTTTTGKAFIGGSKGLMMEFLTGAPPDSVYDTDNQFSISLKVENVGEHDIDSTADATVEITGINPSDFGVSKNDLIDDVPDSLEGASLDSAANVIEGTVSVVDFEDLEYVGTVSGTVPFTLIANVCYEYGTRAQAKLCVLEDLRGTKGEVQFCDPNNQAIDVESSGAPVQVISMTENVLGSNKVSVIFKLRNVGTGTLHEKGTECDTSIPTKNKVWVEVSDTELGSLDCPSLKDGTATTGFVTLYNGEASVRCTQEITSPDDFEKLIEVNMEYGYEEAIQQTLEVKQAS